MLSGPSGVGKSTVVAHMRKVHPEVWLSVSATTRKPRPGERHGVHYFFADDGEFDKLIANGELLEWAEFAGNRYGTPARRCWTAWRPGSRSCWRSTSRAPARSASPCRRRIWSSWPRRAGTSWSAGFTGRGTEAPEVIERRLAAARVELAAEKEFDVTLVNTSVEDVSRELLALMLNRSGDQNSSG